MQTQKVVKLYENPLTKDITAFLNQQTSQNTKDKYERNIRQFFRECEVIQKELEFVTIDDLMRLKKRDLINYRTYLKDTYDNSNKTINNKITSVKGLFRFISSEYDGIRADIFNFKSLPEEQDTEYEHLSQTEGERFAQVALETEREKSFLKYCLILFAIRTSFRLSEILNVRWSDFRKVNDDIYEVTTRVAKGNKTRKMPITASLYNQLLELKEINKEYKWNGDPELVFQITENRINDMMKRLKKRLGVEDRRIVFHSFRGIAIDFALENGSIRDAANQAGHSNINTTWKHYINKKKDYSQMAGIRMEEEIDLSFLDSLSVEDFKEFIKQSDYKVQTALKKFIENK